MRSLFAHWPGLVSILVGLTLVVNCRKSPDSVDPPITLATLDTLLQINSVTSESVRVTSTIHSSGNDPSVTVGHVYSTTNAQPTLTDYDAYSRSNLHVGTVPLRFTTVVTGLQPATQYYVRPYVTNTAGTTYGATALISTYSKQKTVYDMLAKVLDDSLRPKDIGYALTIYQGATLMATAAGGLRSRSIDPEGAVAYTADTKMHIASMSKTITAMTFLLAATQKGLKTTDHIAPYLPKNWPQGTGIDRITFRDLLTHRSGIHNATSTCQGGPLSENEYASLKQVIGKDVTSYGQYCYQNANFALFRVLIPAILGYTYSEDDDVDNANTITHYIDAVRKLVFEPAGIQQAAVSQSAEGATYLYSYPYSGSRGYNTGDLANVSGAIGWYLTAAEAGKLYATVLSSPDQSVLSTSLKDTLLTNRLGCFAGLLTNQTEVYYHDGWWWEADPSHQGTYRGLRTIWMKYPNDVTIVVFVNAINRMRLFPSNDGTDIVDYVDNAYNQAQRIQNGRLAHAELRLEHPEPH